MPTYFQRPENALKRANEFIDVDKPQRALDALYDVIKSKRHRTWQKIHEPIMDKYLELCVELKKSHVAKEGLYQYKNICQQINTKSLEDVIRRYLNLAEEKTEAARLESHQSVVDVDDLDVLQTPESVLMSAVSGEDTQDRTDRAILTPWLKFLWESYRQCLDLLRNNNTVEKLYQEVAQNAFKFCHKYSRKTEFRKLCDNLRTHLGHITKHPNVQRAINLNNPESQTMHLETRLVQLDNAISMELWQEAYKAVEDIHSLIVLSKKQPRPSLMANYYQKLALVLGKSGNHMFHACAWHRLFHLYREQRRNISEHEMQKLASRVMCATLAIPLPVLRNQSDQLLDPDETVVEKQKKLAGLLSLNAPHTRKALVKDLVKYGIVQHVYPELINLYQWLEVEFHPLKLSSRVTTALDFIAKKEELARYVPALQDITIMRVVKQVSQVYQTIEFSHLATLVPFATAFRLERILVEAAKSLDLQVRIDHRNGSLSFGTDLSMSQDGSREGPHVQSMPGDQIRSQLMLMARALDKSINIILPKEIQSVRDVLRMQISQQYRGTAKKDHLYMLSRRQTIENRKEQLEHQSVQREREEQEIQDEVKRKQVEAEQARLEREAEERDRQRRAEEHKDIQRKVAKERLEQIKSTTIGAKAFADLSEEVLANMDMDDILAKQVEQLEKEKREREEKLKIQEKKVDYLERAKCREEIPLLEKQYELEKLEKQQLWEELEKSRTETLIAERENALEQKERLMRIRPDRDAFVAELQQSRMNVHAQRMAEFEKKLAEERKKRLAERRVKRKEDRRRKWINDREEEAQRKRDEELKRVREEEERIAREKRELEKAADLEKMKKLAEIEEKKRKREQEIEDKHRKQLEESKERPRDVDIDRRREGGGREEEDAPWRHDRPAPIDAGRDDAEKGSWKTPAKETGWRLREKAREDGWKKPKKKKVPTATLR